MVFCTANVHKCPSSLEAVLTFLVTWNTNSRNCHEAQAVIETLLKHEAPDNLLQYSGIKSAVESLLPYTGEQCCRNSWAVGRWIQSRAVGRCLRWCAVELDCMQSQLPSADVRSELFLFCALGARRGCGSSIPGKGSGQGWMGLWTVWSRGRGPCLWQRCWK